MVEDFTIIRYIFKHNSDDCLMLYIIFSFRLLFCSLIMQQVFSFELFCIRHFRGISYLTIQYWFCYILESHKVTYNSCSLLGYLVSGGELSYGSYTTSSYFHIRIKRKDIVKFSSYICGFITSCKSTS